MKRLITLGIIVAAIALVAGPAFAEVQNVKVSGDIDSKWIYRSNYDFDDKNTTKDDDNWFMTTTKVQIDADLTDNVSTCVRLVNERDWDVETNVTTDVDLDVAYVTLKEFFYSPLTLMVGRQNLRLGNALVVGDPDTNDAEPFDRIQADDLSTIKGFDAIRATLDYNPTVVDIIYAKIDADTIGATPRDDMDLWGLNVAYDFNNDKNASVEGYLFSRRDRRTANVGASAETGGADMTHVVGADGSIQPIGEELTLNGEVAYQFGDLLDTGASPDRKIDREAWALDLGLVYDGFKDTIELLNDLSLRAAYIFRSGHSANSVDDDVANTTNEFNAWDPMFEDQTHGMIANRIFDGINDGVDSNGRTINVGASVVPLDDMTVSVDYYFYRLDEKYASTNAAGQNRTLRGSEYGVTDKKDLGGELDVALNYAYTEDVNLGLACGWFFPGDAFDNAASSGANNNNDTATEVIASLAVAF